MNILENLTPQEKEKILKFPAYISLLAANNDGKLDEEEKKTAIKTSYIKTYASDPLVKSFYIEADKVFLKNIEALDRTLPRDRKSREEAIVKELSELENIILELGPTYCRVMHKSMKSFKDHVSNAHENVLEYFLFPVPIKGITD